MARFYVGTSGWTYDHWKGLFYPEKLAKNRWFNYYAERFPSVEINATFYRPFADSTYNKWREQVPPGFRYVMKAPKQVTHTKLLNDVEADLEDFWRSASLLEDRLGGVLLQIAPSMPYDLGRLHAALQALGDPTRAAVEFRNKVWDTPEVRALLEQVGAALVSVDSPQSRPTEWVTGRLGYLRLHGRERWYSADYSDADLADFAALLGRMAGRGAEEVYVFFNNDIGGYAPHNALALMKMLGVEGAYSE
jgi:uncharacterized protein YecE (DUF72 family)